MNSTTYKFYTGLSGLQLPIPKYQYPPEHQNSSRLTYYSTFFNSIEINSSFYKVPQHKTVAKWAASVHNSFRFTFKLFQEITHCKNLNYDPKYISQFFESINAVEEKRGCLLVQFPPSLKQDSIHELDRLLNDIKAADSDRLWNLAIEFRDKSWYNDDTYELLESYHAAIVTQDKPTSATPFFESRTDFIYVRFHGPKGDYGGSYTDAFLHEYAGYIREWLSENKSVYVYFNNTKGDAFGNLTTLNSFLS